MKKHIQIKVYGNVQGVGFRASTKYKAEELGLVGWVRNDLLGTVTIVVEGNETQISEFLDWLKSGHMASYIRRFKVSSSDALENFNDFEIRF